MDLKILERLQKSSGLSYKEMGLFFDTNYMEPSFENDLIDLFGYDCIDEISAVIKHYRDLKECFEKSKNPSKEGGMYNQENGLAVKNKKNKSEKKDMSRRAGTIPSSHEDGNSLNKSPSMNPGMRTNDLQVTVSSGSKELSDISQPARLLEDLDKLFLEEGQEKHEEFMENLPKTIKKYVVLDQTLNYKLRIEGINYIFGRQDTFCPKTTTVDTSETTNIHIEAPTNVPKHPLISTEITESDLFPYRNFNTIQSICCGTALFSNKNMLLSAPTGCGKTEIAFMAISRALKTAGKIIYLVPLKALATEVTTKLKSRFKNANILEFTGDTDPKRTEMQKANILIATPEKFDVCTRRFDAIKNISLVIIDEIHILNEQRGAVIEALVCRILRMIEIQQISTRIVGLSATMPNYNDIGRFILAQRVFHFSKEYRPVPLTIEIVGIKEDEQETLDLEQAGDDFSAFLGKGFVELRDLLKRASVNASSSIDPKNTENRPLLTVSSEGCRITAPKNRLSADFSVNVRNSCVGSDRKTPNFDGNDQKPLEDVCVNLGIDQYRKASFEVLRSRESTESSQTLENQYQICKHSGTRTKSRHDSNQYDRSFMNTHKNPSKIQKLKDQQAVQNKKSDSVISNTPISVTDQIRVVNSFGRMENKNKIPMQTRNAYISPQINFAKKSFSFITRKLNELFRERHQCLIFCTSRKETEKLAKKLSQSLPTYVFDFHHAGLPKEKRLLAETNFSKNRTNCLVTTSTLAWGVNLPAHCVIIKDTKFYDKNIANYSNIGVLDILQIFGRAGRPQFDKKGEAVIIVDNKESNEYYRLLKSQKIIESTFLKSVVDFLNAEIYLQNVRSLDEAYQWIQSTFLYVRMRKNPKYYGLSNEEIENNSLKQVICEYILLAIKRLVNVRMITVDQELCDEYLDFCENFGANLTLSGLTTDNITPGGLGMKRELTQRKDTYDLEPSQNGEFDSHSRNRIAARLNLGQNLDEPDKSNQAAPEQFYNQIYNSNVMDTKVIDIHDRKSTSIFLKKHKELSDLRNKNLLMFSTEKWQDPLNVSPTSQQSPRENHVLYSSLTSADSGSALVNWVDPYKLTFRSTPLGRIASHTYLRNETMELFDKNIGFVYDEYSITNLILRSYELSDVFSRDDEEYHLNLLAADLNYVYDKSPIDKMMILLLCYKNNIKIDNFTLHCDQLFVIENFERLLGAFIELCMHLEKYALLGYTKNLEKHFTGRKVPMPSGQYTLLGDFLFIESSVRGALVLQEGEVVGVATAKFDFIKIDSQKPFTFHGEFKESVYETFEKIQTLGVCCCIADPPSRPIFGKKNLCSTLKDVDFRQILDKLIFKNKPKQQVREPCKFTPDDIQSSFKDLLFKPDFEKTKLSHRLRKLSLKSKISPHSSDTPYPANRNQSNNTSLLDHSKPSNYAVSYTTESARETPSNSSFAYQNVSTVSTFQNEQNFSLYQPKIRNKKKRSKKTGPVEQNNLRIMLCQIDDVSNHEKLKLITKKLLEIPQTKKLIITHSLQDVETTKNDLTALLLMKDPASSIYRVKSGQISKFKNECVCTYDFALENAQDISDDCTIIFKGIHGDKFSRLFDILRIIKDRRCYMFDVKSVLDFYHYIFTGRLERTA